jgi:hypothetical protein
MTFTHDDIQNRLIEFLYGELDGAARTAFEAHLAACERCRADVAAFQQTRDVARAAVRAGLEDPVPAGARARILEAAAAARVPAAASSGAAATAARAATGTTGTKPPSKGEATGPFAWLRARWALPMFVTVAAMGALLLVRETIYREARKPLGAREPLEERPVPETTAPAPTTPGPGSPAPSAPIQPPGQRSAGEAAKPAAAAGARQQFREQPKGERRLPPESGPAGGATRPAPADARVARAKAAKAKAPAAKDSIDDLLSGVESRKPAKRDLNDDVLGGMADKSSTRGFAQPPPPRAAAAPAPAMPPTPRESSAASAVMDTEDESPPRTHALQKKRATSGRAEEAGEEGAPTAAAAPVSAPADGEEDQARDVAAAPLVARAERLMASRQWAEAAAAYRQLIARFPKHEQVPNWRRRLAVVEAAAARAAPSK